MSTLTKRWPATGGLLLGVLAATTAADGQCSYTSTPIGYPINCGIGPVSTRVTGLNDNGWVCGTYWCVLSQYKRGFYRTPEGVYVDMGLPEDGYEVLPSDINNVGQISGSAQITGLGYRAFIYEIATADWTLVDPVNPDLGWSMGHAINDAGVLVGYRTVVLDDVAPYAAFSWSATEGLSDMGVPQGPNSSALDISEAGDVTGWIGPDGFVYADGEFALIPAPLGSIESEGRDLSTSSHEVLGIAWYETLGGGPDTRRPFLWIPQSGQTVQFDPLAGFDRATTYDLLNRYIVVGESDKTQSSADDRATLWLSGIAFDVKELVPTCHCTELEAVVEINQSGQLVVSGETVDSNTVAFLLDPIAPRTGDVTGDCQVGVQDLLLVLSQWGQSGVSADIDNNGIVNVFDLLVVLGNWGG